MVPKIVVITGVGQGLGRVMASQFLSLGHRVYGVTRRTENCPPPIERERGQFAAIDVTDLENFQEWGDKILGEVGSPDLLLNNAAIINENRPLWKVPPLEFHRVMEVNVTGVFNGIAIFVPAMVKRGSGVIVNFSSGWGRSTAADVAPYCASKWAIEGLSRALAQELPPGMACVPLNPGIIHTEMLRSCFGDNARSYPDPEMWARKAVPFILSLGPADNGRPLSVP